MAGEGILKTLIFAVLGAFAMMAVPAAAQVVVYKHCNYGGYAVNFAPGSYDLGRVQAKGVRNDDVSAISVAPGFRATLFEHAGYRGRRLVLTGNTNCLISRNFDDLISSLRVVRINNNIVRPPQPPVNNPGFVRMVNRWKSNQSIHIEYGPVQSSNARPGWHSADWIFERAPDGHFRIKNRWKGTYLHAEYARLQSGSIEPGWWSAMWRIEPVSGTRFYRIRNRWKNTYLHTQYDNLQLGQIEQGWWSAMWDLRGF